MIQNIFANPSLTIPDTSLDKASAFACSANFFYSIFYSNVAKIRAHLYSLVTGNRGTPVCGSKIMIEGLVICQQRKLAANFFTANTMDIASFSICE